ncbi:MAG TPA: carboxypeptidase-like regulatory domain-containing protein [Gemmatimonadaceae bacterium]|jgi:hypothetical protein|nr:carboxypeptidase-like regulatory domain-containing protein [Gemmatimonadaceae bacterium]
MLSLQRLAESTRWRWIGALLGFALTSANASAVAQAPLGNLRGFVYRDTVGRPLAGADVVLIDLGKRTVTDTGGAFSFGALSLGLWRIEIRRAGFAIDDENVEVKTGVTSRAFVMHRLAPAAQTAITTPRAGVSRSMAMDGFDLRRAVGNGYFVAPDELRRSGYEPLYEMLQRIPGARIVSYRENRFFENRLSERTGGGAARSTSRAAPRSGVTQHALIADAASPVGCWPQIILDGARVFAPGAQLDVPDVGGWRARDLEAIEFYSDSSAAPAGYSAIGASCGTLLLWTRDPTG